MDMTDPKAQGEQKQNAAELAQEWADLLNTLVPPRTVEVEDITGKVHKLRGSLPAAVEVRVISLLKDVSLPDLGDIPKRISDASKTKDTAESMSSIIDGIAAIAGDESMLSLISECFTMAHPKAVRLAAEAVKADEDLAEYMPVDREPEAMDLFSVSQLVAGIVPFAMRAVSQIGNTVASLLPPKK